MSTNGTDHLVGLHPTRLLLDNSIVDNMFYAELSEASRILSSYPDNCRLPQSGHLDRSHMKNKPWMRSGTIF